MVEALDLSGVVAAEPLVLPGLIDPEELVDVELRCGAFAPNRSPKPYTSFDARTEFAGVPEDLAYAVPMIAAAGADVFGVPALGCQVSVLRYWPGVGHDWHADGSWVHEQSRGRTVSFSLLLNEPGRDFAGGDFETEFGPVELHAGDAVAFTAATTHRVLPVTAGRRLVLVCFAFATDRRDP